MIHQWWFEANLDEFTSYLPNETTDYYWRRLRTCKKTSDLAYICCRIAAIGISEAEVERLFSIQKSMLNRTVTNIGTATLHHRSILHLSKEIVLENI